METTSMIASILSSVLACISAIVVALISKEQRRNKADAEKREHRRMQESRLSLEMMAATMQLSIVCSNALTGGHNNGNVEAAKKAALEAEQKYKDFERQVLSEEIA